MRCRAARQSRQTCGPLGRRAGLRGLVVGRTLLPWLAGVRGRTGHRFGEGPLHGQGRPIPAWRPPEQRCVLAGAGTRVAAPSSAYTGCPDQHGPGGPASPGRADRARRTAGSTNGTPKWSRPPPGHPPVLAQRRRPAGRAGCVRTRVCYPGEGNAGARGARMTSLEIESGCSPTRATGSAARRLPRAGALDASVLPDVPRANTHSPSSPVAERNASPPATDDRRAATRPDRRRSGQAGLSGGRHAVGASER